MVQLRRVVRGASRTAATVSSAAGTVCRRHASSSCIRVTPHSSIAPAAALSRSLATVTATAPSLGGTQAPGTRTVEIRQSLRLVHGGTLAAPLVINYFDSLFFDATAVSKPIVYIMPSMSHSALVTRAPEQQRTQSGLAGWWEAVVGPGPQYGIDLNRFRVISASPLGAPYGTTSPLSIDPTTRRPYRADFPLITPLDQARVHALLLDHLGIAKVHAVVGASMGGMQVLQFAVHYPERYARVIAICTTGQTSSSTQALRSVQRAAVRMDPNYHDGNYADESPSHDGHPVGPTAGLSIARMFGTICYRSREEFDARFPNKLLPRASNNSTHAAHSDATPSAVGVPDLLFEVERYLHHQASTFTGRYDANCYLTLSQCMDLMDLAMSTPTTATTTTTTTANSQTSAPLSYDQACALVPNEKQFLLLPIASDALIPPAEMERLASVLGSQGKRVHVERVHSKYGHDAFLKESATFNPRFCEFLDTRVENGVDQVRRYVNSLSDL